MTNSLARLIHKLITNNPNGINNDEMKTDNEEYEPYFGWCDVNGCKNEGCSGGNAWRNSGYWTVCHTHAQSYRKGGIQPKMKDESVQRELSRDENGYLPISKQTPQ